MIWVSELKFRGNFQSEFEYIFFSYWSDNSNLGYLNKYNEFIVQYFKPLMKECFRTTKYDSFIKNFILENYDMLNLILCNLYYEDYITNSEYFEFCSWLKFIIQNLNIDERLCEFLTWVSFFESYSKRNYFKSQNLLKVHKEIKEHNEKINLIDIEIILISQKFVLALFFNKTPFPLKNNISLNTDGSYKFELIHKLIQFISFSIELCIKPTICTKIQYILDLFQSIQNLLRINKINYIKLFMNFLYYKLKLSENITNFDYLYSIINNAINEWPNQNSFIKDYYEFTLYKNEPIRNLLSEERFTPEVLNGNICNIQNRNTKPLNIPVYKYFYFE